MGVVRVAILAACAISAAAAPPATAPSSPKAAMKAIDAAIARGDFVEAQKHFHYTTPDEEKLARAIIEFSAAFEKLHTAAEKRWGKSGWATVAPALGGALGGADTMTERVEGDQAVLAVGGEPRVPMTRTNGGWKFSIPGVVRLGIKRARGGADDVAPEFIQKLVRRLTPSYMSLAGWADRAARDVDAGKYETAEDLRSAAARSWAAAIGG